MMTTSSSPSTGRALHGINFYGTPTSLLLILSSAVECVPQSCATDTSFGSTRPSANLRHRHGMHFVHELNFLLCLCPSR